MSDPIIVRLTQSASQEVGSIKRIVGLMPAKFLVPLIDELDLEANPRNSKLGGVTQAIQNSIMEDEESTTGPLFPFKSKGILLASSAYEVLDRGRFALRFEDREVEGILDGGHNTLAIGAYILGNALRAAGSPLPRKSEIMIWQDFKQVWLSRKSEIASYIDRTRNDSETLKEKGISLLDFLIPVELLVPADQDDPEDVEHYRSALLEICDARNNNAELSRGTKADKEGLYDSFKALVTEQDPEFAATVSWKTNDGGIVSSRDLIALAWIPLSLISWVSEGPDKFMDAPSVTSIYSGKEKCLDKYCDLMLNDSITKVVGETRRELKDEQVESALKIAAVLPELFDRIYELFPACYNQQGKFGKITAVKNMLNKRDTYLTPFYRRQVKKPVPSGYIYPLVSGLRAIMTRDDKTGRIEWTRDPLEFVDSESFANAVGQYCGVIQQSDYDPQKVGKGAFSYTAAENAIKLAALTS